jgi:hypothetical protein
MLRLVDPSSGEAQRDASAQIVDLADWRRMICQAPAPSGARSAPITTRHPSRRLRRSTPHRRPSSAIPTVGTNLIGVQGAWTGAVSFDRFWLRDGVRIPGASGNAYLIVAGDVGSMLGLEIDANGPGGTTRADAAPIGPVAGP